MLSVSDKWKQAIREQFRYQGYLQVIIQVTPPGLQENMQVNTHSSEVCSSANTLVDEDDLAPTPYATLEPKRWILNGKYDLLSKLTTTDDWWSTILDSAPKILEFVFDQTYNIPGVYIEWDLVNNTYPSEFVIQGYNNLDDKVYEYTINDIQEAKGFTNAPMDGVKKVILTVTKWIKSGWRVRINTIMFGLYASYDSINNGRVVSGEFIDSSDPLSNELPAHTMSVELRNLDKTFDPSLETGISKYLAQRQLVKYRWGFATSYNTIEWAPTMRYYVQEFKVPSDSKNVSISTTSRLAFLTSNLKAIEYTAEDITLYDLATLVLEQSEIIRNTSSEKPWRLSDKLKTLRTNAPMPDEAVNVILELIANAAGLRLFIDSTSGYVCIDEFEDTPIQDIGLQQELGDPEITIQEQLRTVSVGITTYTKSIEVGKTEVGKGEYKLTGTVSLKVSYSCDYAVDVTCSVVGATLITFVPYSSYAIVELDAGDEESDVTVTLSGFQVVKNTTYVQTYINSTIDKGLDVTLDNPFVTNTESLQMLTDFILKWYSKPQQQSIKYIGYPELTAGDVLHISTIYGDSQVGIVKSTLSFDGSFSGTLEVR